MDKSLDTKTIRHYGHFTLEDAIVANLLYRRGVRVAVLMKLFGVGKGMIYYKCLTGNGRTDAEKDRQPIRAFGEDTRMNRNSNLFEKVKATIKKMGEDEAWKMYVTDKTIDKVNRLNRETRPEKRGVKRAA